MEDFIQLKEDSIYRLGIKDKNGNETGEYLEFDLENIETPLKYNHCDYLIKKAKSDLKMKLTVIAKKPDKKEGLLSSNKIEEITVTKECFKTMEEAIDEFAGEGATTKLFGKRRYLTMFDDFNEYIEPFLPKLKINLDNITNKIKSKYSTSKEDDVLEDE